ncbi:MAG: urease accessory protein UreE [bacterium]
MLKLIEKCHADTPSSTTVTLPLDQRVKSRLRVTLEDGRDAGIFLPRGETLNNGDCLRSESGEVVKVVAADETVSTASCHDPLLLARACYHLGNRHVPLQIEEGRLCYQHDHVLDDMLRGLGLPVMVEKAPFEPEPGAYGGSSSGGHHHHHHTHDADHDHGD